MLIHSITRKVIGNCHQNGKMLRSGFLAQILVMIPDNSLPRRIIIGGSSPKVDILAPQMATQLLQLHKGKVLLRFHLSWLAVGVLIPTSSPFLVGHWHPNTRLMSIRSMIAV